MGYSRLEPGYNPATSGVINLPDGSVLNIGSMDWGKQVDAIIDVAKEFIGYDFADELFSFVTEVIENPWEGAYDTDETADARKDYNKIAIKLRMLIQELVQRLEGQRTVQYGTFLYFADEFDKIMDEYSELEEDVVSGYSDEDRKYVYMNESEYNAYYRQIRNFVDTARRAVNDEYADALENTLAGVLDDGEYIRNDDDYFRQMNPLLIYNETFSELEHAVQNFTRAVSKKQKVTVKAFKELLAYLQNELNKLPKN